MIKYYSDIIYEVNEDSLQLTVEHIFNLQIS